MIEVQNVVAEFFRFKDFHTVLPFGTIGEMLLGRKDFPISAPINANYFYLVGYNNKFII